VEHTNGRTAIGLIGRFIFWLGFDVVPWSRWGNTCDRDTAGGWIWKFLNFLETWTPRSTKLCQIPIFFEESRYFRSFPESIRGPATFRGMVRQGRLNSETPWNSNVLRISKSAKTLVLMFMISLWWFLIVYWLKDPSTAINRLPQADGGRKPLWRLGVSADLPEVFDPRSTASWPGPSWHCIIQWNGALNLQLASKQPWLRPQKGES